MPVCAYVRQCVYVCFQILYNGLYISCSINAILLKIMSVL